MTLVATLGLGQLLFVIDPRPYEAALVHFNYGLAAVRLDAASSEARRALIEPAHRTFAATVSSSTTRCSGADALASSIASASDLVTTMPPCASSDCRAGPVAGVCNSTASATSRASVRLGVISTARASGSCSAWAIRSAAIHDAGPRVATMTISVGPAPFASARIELTDEGETLVRAADPALLVAYLALEARLPRPSPEYEQRLAELDAAVEKLLDGRGSGRVVELPGGGRVIRSRNQLEFEREKD